ncbi:MAG: hypothetical protein AB7U45_03815 [Desulfamplus sp.]
MDPTYKKIFLIVIVTFAAIIMQLYKLSAIIDMRHYVKEIYYRMPASISDEAIEAVGERLQLRDVTGEDE